MVQKNLIKKSRFTHKDNAKSADLNYRSLIVMWMIILLYNKVRFDKKYTNVKNLQGWY
jgi:hypothetical protein